MSNHRQFIAVSIRADRKFCFTSLRKFTVFEWLQKGGPEYKRWKVIVVVSLPIILALKMFLMVAAGKW